MTIKQKLVKWFSLVLILKLAYCNVAYAQTWVATTALETYWASIAMSADGVKLAATVNTSQPFIFLSTNSGLSWFQSSAPSNNWGAIESSADGTRLIAASWGNGVYTSSNSGVTWISNSLPALSWKAVTSSANGQTLMAVAVNCAYVSHDYGSSWTSNNLPGFQIFVQAASSADGEKLIISTTSGSIYTSTNSGISWSQAVNAPQLNWWSLGMSADARVIIALGQWFPTNGNFGLVYTSTNFAESWVSNSLPLKAWSTVAISPEVTSLFQAR